MYFSFVKKIYSYRWHFPIILTQLCNMKDINHIGVLMRCEIILIVGVHIWKATVPCKNSNASLNFSNIRRYSGSIQVCKIEAIRVFWGIPLLDKHNDKVSFLINSGKGRFS